MLLRSGADRDEINTTRAKATNPLAASGRTINGPYSPTACHSASTGEIVLRFLAPEFSQHVVPVPRRIAEHDDGLAELY